MSLFICKDKKIGINHYKGFIAHKKKPKLKQTNKKLLGKLFYYQMTFWQRDLPRFPMWGEKMVVGAEVAWGSSLGDWSKGDLLSHTNMGVTKHINTLKSAHLSHLVLF